MADEISAGPELDLLLHNKLQVTCLTAPLLYSTVTAAAFSLLELVIPLENYVFDLSYWNGDWSAALMEYRYAKHYDESDWRDSSHAACGEADSIALAICRMLLDMISKDEAHAKAVAART
jgi:hypothetical protein